MSLRNLYEHLDADAEAHDAPLVVESVTAGVVSVADAGHSEGPEGSGVSTDPARNPQIGVTDPVPGDLPC